MKTADELAAIAIELAIRVRDEQAEANGRWLGKVLPDPADQRALCFVLAAAVPDDQPWTELTAWAHRLEGEPPIVLPIEMQPGELQPCGTIAAARRHRYYAEPLDLACKEAERARDRKRRNRRNRRKAAA